MMTQAEVDALLEELWELEKEQEEQLVLDMGCFKNNDPTASSQTTVALPPCSCESRILFMKGCQCGGV